MLDNQPLLTNAIQSAIDSVRQMIPPLQSTPLLMCILSPLAEGADRLVAREVLHLPTTVLEVILPMEKVDYIQDFETEKSKKEFEELLAEASSIRTLSPTTSRVEAYEQAGRYVVDQCDVLIAIWDGKSSAGRGSTQETVQYAKDNSCPLVWIHAEDPSRIDVEMGRGLDTRPFYDLDEYNSERVAPARFKSQFSRYAGFFAGEAKNAKLPSDRLRPTIEYILSHYVRGDILALNYQHIYYRAEMLVYMLALAAVVIAAFQIIFMPDRPIILVSEILLMLSVLGIVYVGKRRRWHKKWIDYRFLAERFRSAIFMAVASVEVTMLRPPRHLSLAYEPKDWMVGTFASVWSQRPRWKITNNSLLERVSKFLCEAWIEDQIQFHAGTQKRHRQRHRLMTKTSYTLFGLTIVVAILHVADVGPHLLATIFAFMAVTLPAAAASTTAVRTHRDYLRNSMRSAEMVRHLTELKDKMACVHNLDRFFTLVKETEETMLHENEDWRVVVRFHTIEPA
ncbi:hypothetical protein ACFLYR_02290 [Chloroflexota bacterium]